MYVTNHIVADLIEWLNDSILVLSAFLTLLMLVEIESSVSVENIDTYYHRLKQASEVSDNIDLHLPTELKVNAVGLVASLYQFVATWIRGKASGRLLLDINLTDDEPLPIFKNELLFPVISFSWNRGVFNLTEEDLRRFLAPAMAQLRMEMVKGHPLKGHKLLLVSFDHFPPSSGLIPIYENLTGFIDNESNTNINLRDGMNSVLSFNYQSKTEYLRQQKVFIGIIHELIKNTYEWGRTDKEGVKMDPNMLFTILRCNLHLVA